MLVVVLQVVVIQQDLIEDHVVYKLVRHLGHHGLIDLYLCHRGQIVELNELNNISRRSPSLLVLQHL